MQHTNVSAGATVAASSAELEDKILCWLPVRLRRWLQEEAATDYDVVQLFRQLRAGCTEDNLLRALRNQQRQETAQLYGRGHPQAAFSTAG